MCTDKLNDARKYLQDWLKRSQEASVAAPQVQQSLEMIEWETKTIRNSPSEASVISTNDVDEHADRVFRGIQENLPMIPKINANFIADVGSSTVSSTSAMVTYVSDVSRLDTQETREFASNALEEFNKIQYKYQFPNEVKLLIVNVFPTLEARFTFAKDAYDKYIAGHGELSTAALEIRTYIEGMKGQLFELAREHNKENMTFDVVLSRLFQNSTRKVDVEEQFNKHAVLISEMSTLAKRRDTVNVSQMQALWAQVLNYSYIILTPLRSNNG